MNLLTKADQERLPPLYSQDGKGDEAIAYVKYFHPLSNYTAYATEYNPTTKIFFGLVQCQEEELGYFSLEELEETVVCGLPIERDHNFQPTPLKKLRRLS